MDLHQQARQLGELEWLDQVASPLAEKVKQLIPRGPVKDLLSGTRLGHPLHPVLTDLPIGLFISVTVLDLDDDRDRRALREASRDTPHHNRRGTSPPGADCDDIRTGHRRRA